MFSSSPIHTAPPAIIIQHTDRRGSELSAFEDSLQDQNISPMAISLGSGILFATGIMLVLVPCLYIILEDTRGCFTAPSKE